MVARSITSAFCNKEIKRKIIYAKSPLPPCERRKKLKKKTDQIELEFGLLRDSYVNVIFVYEV